MKMFWSGSASRKQAMMRRISSGAIAPTPARGRAPEAGGEARHLERGHRLDALEAGAVDADEEVDRDLVDVERAQVHRQLGAVLRALAHAEDPADAGAQAELLGVGARGGGGAGGGAGGGLAGT